MQMTQPKKHALNVRLTGALVLSVFGLGGCCHTLSGPASIKAWAADLPARADGQYALIGDDAVKKSLVTKDAFLQCKIDVSEETAEADSPACLCAKSHSSDWISDCRKWLGTHTPQATPVPAPEPTAEPAPKPCE